MMGAVAGDVIGSVYEHSAVKHTEFPLFQTHSRFTDDSVLTLATAEALLESREYGATYREFGRRYPRAGYGGTFLHWIFDETMGPYGSWGNGSAMRVSPVGWAFDSEADVLEAARASAAVTHDHPEGIRGAQAVALAVFLARSGAGKEQVRSEITSRFGYDLSHTVEEIRPDYRFDVSCQGSVPEALIAFLDSESSEDAVRLAISLGGDADTQAAIAGAVAEAYYGGVPAEIVGEVRARLTPELLRVVDAFQAAYPSGT